MNEQNLDVTQGEAEHLLSGGVLTAVELCDFYRRVIELCKAHMKATSELAVLRRQTEGVMRGDSFRRAYQDMMDRGGE